jgi:IS30 family transposase
MMGKNHQGALLVMTDRATLHTLTFDNDKAFAGHRAIGLALGLETYFTRPYTSQDKGTVENRIGQIRCFPPKLV